MNGAQACARQPEQPYGESLMFRFKCIMNVYVI